jgi:hypothetical protein
MRTRAVRDGDTYVLTGQKLWITNAGVSDFYLVFAKTDPEAGHNGISCFVVEKSFPGFRVSKLERKLGVRGSPTGEITLDGCAVPAENLVGDEGRGFHYAMGALDRSRPLVGAQALGIARGALDLATRYVGEREQFGSRLADFQGLQFMLADMATQVEAAALLVYRACSLLDSGLPGTGSASSMAKLFASDTAMRVTTDCVQLLGGIGYTKDVPASGSCATPRSRRSTRAPTRSSACDREGAPATVTGDSRVRLRYSPAPTGNSHIGNMRTALFNWLQARHVGGTFILRIEDTDVARSTQESIEQIQHVLRWGRSRLGRGTDPAEHALRSVPRRSAAPARFGPRVRMLLHRGRGARANELAMKEGRTPGYDGRCRNLTVAERAAFVAEGRPRSIRFRTPDEGRSTFVDVVRGEVSVEWSTVPDFVIVRSNGTPVFFLANAVDDADMGITHVLRGDDLLDSTHRVLALRKRWGTASRPYMPTPR